LGSVAEPAERMLQIGIVADERHQVHGAQLTRQARGRTRDHRASNGPGGAALWYRPLHGTAARSRSTVLERRLRSCPSVVRAGTANASLTRPSIVSRRSGSLRAVPYPSAATPRTHEVP